MLILLVFSPVAVSTEKARIVYESPAATEVYMNIPAEYNISAVYAVWLTINPYSSNASGYTSEVDYLKVNNTSIKVAWPEPTGPGTLAGFHVKYINATHNGYIDYTF